MQGQLSFAPMGLREMDARSIPAINRWAIFGRPVGTAMSQSSRKEGGHGIAGLLRQFRRIIGGNRTGTPAGGASAHRPRFFSLSHDEGVGEGWGEGNLIKQDRHT
jgi:hypothetical protein